MRKILEIIAFMLAILLMNSALLALIGLWCIVAFPIYFYGGMKLGMAWSRRDRAENLARVRKDRKVIK